MLCEWSGNENLRSSKILLFRVSRVWLKFSAHSERIFNVLHFYEGLNFIKRCLKSFRPKLVSWTYLLTKRLWTQVYCNSCWLKLPQQTAVNSTDWIWSLLTNHIVQYIYLLSKVCVKSTKRVQSLCKENGFEYLSPFPTKCKRRKSKKRVKK